MDRLRDQLRTKRFAKIIEIISVFFVAFIIIKIFVQPDSDNLIYNQAVIWIANIIMLSMVPHAFKNIGDKTANLVVIFPTNVWEYDVLDYFPFEEKKLEK